MANPSNDKGGSSSAPPPRRSRTKRDPSGDKVYSVPPQDFAGTVQRLTGAAATAQSSQAPAAPFAASAAADGAPRRRSPSPSGSSTPQARALVSVSVSVSVSAPRSMQEAYLAWCASNNVLLSPGTMAEMERGAQSLLDY